MSLFTISIIFLIIGYIFFFIMFKCKKSKNLIASIGSIVFITGIVLMIIATIKSCSSDDNHKNQTNDNYSTSSSSNYYNDDDEYGFSDYLKEQDPDLYDSIKDRYDSIKNEYYN